MRAIYKPTKKQCILISLLLACILCIVGFFGIFSKKEERITVSAATSTDESKMYWEDGASILIDTTQTVISFILHLHKDVFNGGDVVVTIDKNASNECFFNEEWSAYGAVVVSETKIRFSKDALQDEFSSDGWITLRVMLNTDYTTNVSLTASNATCTAKSTERNWLYVYEKAVELGVLESGFDWGASISEFVKNVDPTSFEIYGNYWLDSYTGLVMLANVPTAYTNLIEQERLLVAEETTERWGVELISYQRFEEYFLSFNLQLGTAPDKTSTVWDEGASIYTFESISTRLQNNTILDIATLPRGENLDGGRYYYMSLVKKITEYIGLGGADKGVAPTISYQVVNNSNSIEVDVKGKALEIAGRDDLNLNEREREWLLDISGRVPQTETMPVTVKYRKLSDETNPSSVTLDYKQFSVKRVDITSKKLVVQTLYDTLEGISNLADFNVCYKGQFWESGYVYNTGERIILQATGYEYKYDKETQRGELTVIYNEFQYKEVALKVVNNDLESNLEMLCYTTDVNIDPDTNYITMRWDFATIEETLLNACKWHFFLRDGDFKFNFLPSSVNATFERDEDNIPQALVLTFPQTLESQLISADIVVEALIEPIVDCSVNYQYIKLSINDSGDILEETITSDTLIMDSMTLKRYNTTNFMSDYGSIINRALVLEEIEGDYCKVVAVRRNQNLVGEDEMPSYTFIVEYEYNTLFKITNNKSSDVRYIALNDTSLYYKGADFVRADDIPDGHRVERFTTTSTDLKITPDENNADDYTKTSIEVKTGANQKKILPVHIVYTDKWHLTFDYFETYKNTPFAIKKTYNGDISVKDYPNIRAMTATDICNVTGISAVVVKIIKVDEKVDITFDGVATYKAVLNYSHASMATRDYNDKNLQEIQVPLSKYEDWVTGLGNPNWSIMMLNTKDNKYFEFSNDVERDKLYGLFSTAVFEEEVSDLNFYFRNQTGDGYMTIFEHTEAQGSKVYKFFHRWTDKEWAVIPGRVGMFFCEVLNNDNKMLHSYAFYLDGSTNEPYMTNSGADDKYDDDSAIKNKGQDIWDDVKSNVVNGWNKFKNSKWYTVAKVLLWIAGGCLVVGVAWKYGRRFFMWVTSDKQAVKRSDWTPTYAQKKNKSKAKSKSKSKSKRKSRKK